MKKGEKKNEGKFDIKGIYTPLSVAKKEIWRRWNDKELRKKVDDFLGGDVPDAELKVVRMEDLSEKITTKAFERSNLLKNTVVISSCLEISSPHCGHTLEINRVIDINGGIVGLGSRPGHPCLDDQIKGIASLTARQPVVLVVRTDLFPAKPCAILCASLKSGRLMWLR